MTGTVHGTAGDGTYTITLENEGKRNAISYPMLEALLAEVEARAGSDDVLLIRGAGEQAFSAGFDLTQERTSEGTDLWNRTTDAVASYPYPTIAMINGDVYGGAVYLAAICDVRIAHESARFGVTPAKIGIVYPPRSIERLVELVGPAHAKELLFTGAAITAERAADIGLANHVVPADEFESRGREMADQIASNAPLSLKYMKRIADAIVERGTLSDVERAWGQRFVEEAFASRDYEEGKAAFAEGREPEFEGR